jgi:hypothetical protein
VIGISWGGSSRRPRSIKDCKSQRGKKKEENILLVLCISMFVQLRKK